MALTVSSPQGGDKKVDKKVDKKKVLFASKDLSVGGMERALVTLLNNFDFSKYDVTLLLEKKSGALLCDLDCRVKIIEYKVSTLGVVPLRKALNFIRRLLFAARHGGKYDFSCCYATYSIPCRAAAFIACPNNRLLFVHSDYVSMYNGDAERAREFFKEISLESYEKVAFVSLEAEKSAAALFDGDVSERFFTVGNLVNTKEILSLSKAEIPEDEAADGGGEYVFVFSGRLDDTSKKLRRLIDAVKIAEADGYDFRVWIVGDGKDADMYRDYAKRVGVGDVVRFFGEKANPYPYIRRADCLVLTSDYEGFPMVFAEAALLKKKIITTVCASDGYMTFDKTTVLMADKTSESVADSMERAMDARGMREQVYPFDFDKINLQKMNNLYKLMDV